MAARGVRDFLEAMKLEGNRDPLTTAKDVISTSARWVLGHDEVIELFRVALHDTGNALLAPKPASATSR
ncbi:hypothetical protein D3C83_273510 [compost metagenome]